MLNLLILYIICCINNFISCVLKKYCKIRTRAFVPNNNVHYEIIFNRVKERKKIIVLLLSYLYTRLIKCVEEKNNLREQ